MCSLTRGLHFDSKFAFLAVLVALQSICESSVLFDIKLVALVDDQNCLQCCHE